jgi:hypothetical protein
MVASSLQPWRQWPLPCPHGLGEFLVLTVSSTCSMIAWLRAHDLGLSDVIFDGGLVSIGSATARRVLLFLLPFMCI